VNAHQLTVDDFKTDYLRRQWFLGVQSRRAANPALIAFDKGQDSLLPCNGLLGGGLNAICWFEA
jgi:hypothetical protein